MRLEDLNALGVDEAARELRRCCGSTRWVRLMMEAMPFADAAALATAGDAAWLSLAPSDWLEAFAAHPRIGQTGGASEAGSGEAGRSGRVGGSERTGAVEWSRLEQAGVADAAETTRS